MFETWVDGLIFGIIATFFSAVLTSIIAKFNLESYTKSNHNTNAL